MSGTEKNPVSSSYISLGNDLVNFAQKVVSH